MKAAYYIVKPNKIIVSKGIDTQAVTKAIIRRKSEDISCDFSEDLHPLLAKIYKARNITKQQDLEHTLSRLASVELFSNINPAADLLTDAIQQQQRILIVADFDADGATSCVLAIRALRAFGAKCVDYIVPNRFEYGYGLTPEIVAVANQRQPDLIITVDNGISSIDGVKAAKKLGIKVLITDHHLPGKELPNADAIVNPNLPDDLFPSKCIAGVGVIFYIMLALRKELRKQEWFESEEIIEPNLAQYLDLVALGTVADVVQLDFNNRILVSQGLARIRSGQCCVGISALLEIGNRNRRRIVASDLGFIVGPRLNAAGRLEDMSIGIECLLTDDVDQAKFIAQQLDVLNKERRSIESQMQQQAINNLAELRIEDNDNKLPIGLCIFDENWHQGVIGILASRIKEKIHRPVIAFAKSTNDELKGSARSIQGLHIRDVLDAIATRQPDLIAKFGGHAMAAGLTLKKENLGRFKTAFDKEVRRHLSDDDLKNVILSDGELSVDEISLEVAEQLRAGGPWGQGIPEPIFDGIFEVAERRIVGEKHLKLLLQIPKSSIRIDAIAFNVSDDLPVVVDQVKIAYKLDVNEYRGQRTPQLIIEHIDVIQ